jgi:SAM-dependent methyltransferase
VLFQYAAAVDPLAPNNVHAIALQLVGEGKQVLELGAASGHVTRALVERGNSVCAVEAEAGYEEHLRAITQDVLIADLERLDLVRKLAGRTFDVVLAGDVLEHTTNAPLILDQVRHLLNPSGYLVVSLPNISHGDVRLALLQGVFRYRDTGLLDRTHRVFYTLESAAELLYGSGFCDLEVFTKTVPVGQTEMSQDSEGIPSYLVDYVKSDPTSTFYQYVIRARPRADLAVDVDSLLDLSDPNSSEDFSQSPQFHTLRLQNQSLESLNRQLIEEISSLRTSNIKIHEEARLMKDLEEALGTQLTRISEGFKTQYLAALSEIAVVNTRNTQLQHTLSETIDRLAKEMTRSFEAEGRLLESRRMVAKASHLQLELNRVRSSTTWKLGRFLMLPVRAVRRLFRAS